MDLSSFLIGLGSGFAIGKTPDKSVPPAESSDTCIEDLAFTEAAYAAHRAASESSIASLQTQVAQLQTALANPPALASAFTADPSIAFTGASDPILERVNGVIHLKDFATAPVAIDLYEYIRNGAGGPSFSSFSGAPTTKTRLASPADPSQSQRVVPLDSYSLYAFEVVGLQYHATEIPLLLIEFENTPKLAEVKQYATFFGAVIWLRSNVMLLKIPPAAPKNRSFVIATGPESDTTFLYNYVSHTMKGHNYSAGVITVRSASVVTTSGASSEQWISESIGPLNPPRLPVSGPIYQLGTEWTNPGVGFDDATYPATLPSPVRIVPCFYMQGETQMALQPFKF